MADSFRHQSQIDRYSEAPGLLGQMVGQSEAYERRGPEEGFKVCGGMTLEGGTPRELRGAFGSATIRKSSELPAGGEAQEPRSAGPCDSFASRVDETAGGFKAAETPCDPAGGQASKGRIPRALQAGPARAWGDETVTRVSKP